MVETSSLSMFWTKLDKGLTGQTESRDPLGLLPVWSARGRELVPHLTEQTVRAEGFQLLVAIYWLWEKYLRLHTDQGAAQRAFYLVAEQAFAHAAIRATGAWMLPGNRRASARRTQESPSLSENPPDMLLDNQLANGTWGLYRGAAMRAGLLTKDFTRLSQVAEESCTARPPLADIHCKQTLALLEKALRDSKAGAVFQTKAMPELVEAMALVVTQMPQKELLKNLLVSTPDITRELAASAVDMDDSWGWQRRLLGQVMHERPALRDPIANAIRCESFIGPVESAFWWICSQKGRRLPESAADLPLNTTKLQNAISNFCNSGHYPPGGSRNRFHLYTTRIDVTSKSVFLESVMALHARIAEERKRSPWVLLEDGKIVANVDVGEPLGDAQLQSAMDPDSAWRNDYYLHPLRSLGKQLGIDGEGAR